ncbi:10864_t:CDS:2, partial [Racocetra fulgida]
SELLYPEPRMKYIAPDDVLDCPWCPNERQQKSHATIEKIINASSVAVVQPRIAPHKHNLQNLNPKDHIGEIISAILISKSVTIIKLLKEIEYPRIPEINDAVIKSVLLKTFQQTPPGIETITLVLKELISLGFNLHYKLIDNILVDFLTQFQNHLDTIMILVELLREIKGESLDNFMNKVLAA